MKRSATYWARRSIAGPNLDGSGDRSTAELLSAVTKERDELRGALERIAEAYRAMFPVDDCPPMPHGCDRCEIHYWLNDVVPVEEKPQ